EEELEILLRRWSKAKTGKRTSGVTLRRSRYRQVATNCGAAGSHSIRATQRLRNFCSPQHTDSALYPTIGQLERAAGFTRDDTLQAKLDKLDLLLAQTPTSAQDAALFAEMLSLPNDGRYPKPDLTTTTAQATNAGSARFPSCGFVEPKPVA